MMSNVARLKRDDEPVRLDPDKFNLQGLPRISDSEHMRRALQTDNPHQYIADRSGTMNFEGEDGTGFFNAVDMHLALLEPDRKSSYAFSSEVTVDCTTDTLRADDIELLLSSTSFHAALNKIGYDHLPEFVRAVLDDVSGRDYKEELSPHF